MIQRLGKYELFETLGSGAAADVYRARDTMLDREVAVKILKPGRVADATAFARFVQEARTAARLFHPNIATVLDIGDADGRYFFVMRYIAGKSLDRLLKENGPLSWEETLHMAQQIGAALDYAHQSGFLHRDVKPSNIIRSSDGSYVLTDFGLTRAMMSAGLTSHTGAVLGTPSYIAPEIWEGMNASPATDVYALACVVYEMITGQMLFAGVSPPEVMKRHFDPLVLPTQWPRGTPAGVEAVLRNALAKEPGERYASCVEFAGALGKAALLSPPIFDPQDTGAGKVGNGRKWGEGKGADSIPAWAGWATAGVLGLVVLILIGILIAIAVHNASTVPTPTQVRVVSEYTRTPVTLSPSETLAPSISTPQSTRTPVPTDTSQPTSPPTESSACTAIGQAWTSPVDGMTLSCVPAGEFWMGSTDSDSQAYDDEKPRHKVYLDAFWIDRIEVTNAMFTAFVQATNYQTDAEKGGWGYAYNLSTNKWTQTNGADWQHPHGSYSDIQGLKDHPVVQISWNDANAYCGWAGRRLPSEAQWEKAARGADERIYPWGNQPAAGNLLNFADANLSVTWADKSIDDDYQFTAPVGSYPAGASSYDVLDMAGNVWEWVTDWYDANYYTPTPASNPTGPSSGEYRVLRGGSWLVEDTNVRAARRNKDVPDDRNDNIGFRCSR